MDTADTLPLSLKSIYRHQPLSGMSQYSVPFVRSSPANQSSGSLVKDTLLLLRSAACLLCHFSVRCLQPALDRRMFKTKGWPETEPPLQECAHRSMLLVLSWPP